MRPHTAVIRVYDESGNVIETHEHAGDNVSPFRHATFTIRNLTLAAPWIIDCSTMSVITVKRVIKRAPKERSRIRRSFGGLARQFAHESSCQFAIEGLMFAVLLAISAWPIFAAVDAVK
jgi:hypothetical protein